MGRGHFQDLLGKQLPMCSVALYQTVHQGRQTAWVLLQNAHISTVKRHPWVEGSPELLLWVPMTQRQKKEREKKSAFGQSAASKGVGCWEVSAKSPGDEGCAKGCK